VPVVWLDLDLPVEVLVARVEARAATGQDPSDATVDTVHAQLTAREPITEAELAAAPDGPPPLHVRVGPGELSSVDRLLDGITARLRLMRREEPAS
jgi:hypothetical protein